MILQLVSLVKAHWGEIVMVSPFVTRAIYSLRNGGGIKGLVLSIWCGTNTPKAPASEPDVKREQSVPEVAKAATLAIATALLAGSVFLFGGCASVPADGSAPRDTKRLEAIAKLAAFDGTVIYLKKHPESRATFELAHAELTKFVDDNGGQLSLGALLNVMDELPVKQLQGEYGAVIVGSAIILFDEFVGDKVEVDSAQLRPVAVAIRDGIGMGLGK